MKGKFSHSEEVRLDAKDKKILELLNKDARMSLTQIAKKTGIPIDTVRYRIQRMEKEKVYRYATVIDPLKIGYPIFNVVYLQLVNYTEEEEKRLISFVMSHPNLVYAAKMTGKYDFIISVVAKNIKEFDRLLNEIKTKFQYVIKELDVFSVIEEYKYDYFLDLIKQR